jgi:hypothetical protein
METAANSIEAALDDLDDTVPSIIAQGNRATSKTGVTSETAFFRFDDYAIIGGHGYRIEVTGVSLQPASDASTQVGAVRTRITTDGSTPTTASTEIGILRQPCPTTSNAPFASFSTWYYPASNETLSVLWTLTREAGTVNQQLGAASGGMKFSITDQGIAPAASGTSI